MRLSRRIAIFAAISVLASCSDSSGPPSTATFYRLDTVNGRPLPTFFSPIPEAPTIIAGGVFLDGKGHATVTERRHETTGADVTYTTNYKYTIADSRIEFEPDTPCPANAFCPAPPTGVFLSRHLFLDLSNGNGDVIYDYLQGALVD